MLPGALTAPEFELEGRQLRAVSVGQGDTEYSTVLHVLSSAAVVGGDVVYLRDFSRIVNERHSVEAIVAAMLELHGDRDNPRVLWHSAPRRRRQARLTAR